ncbi:MAG: hypothetical protein LC632_01895 [Xanthomonadaceae bacterium]|nr:hypothetical protein [Xanthomonadaceae bacterium]
MKDEPFPPVIGDWYKNQKGELFEVVALDEEDGSVDIQYFDGSLESIDVDAWFELALVPVEPPEDWSGSMDIEREDYGVDIDETPPGNTWNQSLDRLE